MPKYSPRAAKALAMLKQHYNDVDIFVEDTSNHNMWLLLMQAILPAGTKLESVNMLGGRLAVEKACALDQTDDGRRKLYIIDGDLDFLLGKRTRRLKYFYRLKANNVENLILSELALTQIALEHQPLMTQPALRSLIEFPATLLTLDIVLRPLFVAYAVTQKLCPSLQTTAFPVNKLIVNTKKGPRIDPIKVRRRIIALYVAVARQVSLSTIRKARSSIAMRSSSLPITQIVSGKDYLLPIFLLQFQARCGYPSKVENFKVALARSFGGSAEPYFARRVRSI